MSSLCGRPPTNRLTSSRMSRPSASTLVDGWASCVRKRSSPYSSLAPFMASLMPSVKRVRKSPGAKLRVNCSYSIVGVDAQRQAGLVVADRLRPRPAAGAAAAACVRR